MASVESKKKSLLSRSVGLLRRVGESVLLGVVRVRAEGFRGRPAGLNWAS